VGDGLYGGRNQAAGGASTQLKEAIYNFDRQALHAVALGFVHPGSGQPVNYSSPLPADFAALVQALADDQ
jgi:23S rRNA pseudouridine1911/1915/1917 synthase